MSSSHATGTSSVRRRSGASSSSATMPLFRLAALLLLGLISASSPSSSTFAAAAAAEPSVDNDKNKKKGVIALDAKNFDSSLRDGKIWLIEFYAPWCGHCVRFAPTYETVAAHFHEKQTSTSSTSSSSSSSKKSSKPSNRPQKREVNVAKVDGASERALASRFGVEGFPSFYLVDGWTVREFDGSRSREGLVKFAEQAAAASDDGTVGGEVDASSYNTVPFLFGPFGPMGQLKGWLMRVGTWAIGLYEGLTEGRGYPPLVAMAVLCVGGLVTGLVAIVVVGLLFLPKAKQD